MFGYGNVPDVVAAIDMTESFDLDSLLSGKQGKDNGLLRDEACMVALALIRHKRGATFDSLTQKPVLLMQHLIRILFTTMESVIADRNEVSSMKREMEQIRKQLKRWNFTQPLVHGGSEEIIRVKNLELTLHEFVKTNKEDFKRLKAEH
jgi:hypothetical protein